MSHDDVPMCNCAECQCELYGESARGQIALGPGSPEFVAGRIYGRPYCSACLQVRRPPPGQGTKDDESPWGENAVRALEDG